MMKVLYAIQGTGNGHISRAKDIVPLLQKKVNLDILISGTQADIQLPFDIKYRYHGLSFTFGKKGGIDLKDTWIKINTPKLIREIKSLPVKEYDLVINDFEPVSAWAAKLRKVRCISFSHQSAVMNKNSPKSENSDLFGKFILQYYAPVTKSYGFHFEKYDENIFTPVIRNDVRNTKTCNNGHYTVYLPAYGDEKIIEVLSHFKETCWHVFSKHSKTAYKAGNIEVASIENNQFIESIATCRGVLCGAGFETPAETLFLRKKLLVIPMTGQFEQQCNAAALQKMGVPVISNLNSASIPVISQWLKNKHRVIVDYPDETELIIDKILREA
jgi:uncharacterized protein (TIGR00661 family)